MNGTVTSIARNSCANSGAKPDPEGLQRVVLQFGDRVLRGFTDPGAWVQAADGAQSRECVPFRALGSEGFEEISLSGLKAAFFVKRFDGPGLDEMRFHDHLSPQANLWVRVVFLDGEVIEGLVENHAEFVLQPGFLLTPTDPDANHWLIYVAKGQVREFQVLGLRASSKG